MLFSLTINSAYGMVFETGFCARRGGGGLSNRIGAVFAAENVKRFSFDTSAKAPCVPNKGRIHVMYIGAIELWPCRPHRQQARFKVSQKR